MSDHYTWARRAVEAGNLADHNKAPVHALLYIGEQLEVIAGIFGSASVASDSMPPDPTLTREESGLSAKAPLTERERAAIDRAVTVLATGTLPQQEDANTLRDLLNEGRVE